MRKQIFNTLIAQLKRAVYDADGKFRVLTDSELAAMQQAKATGGEKINYVFLHFDLWNHNVEFIDQEDQWNTPAVFFDFQDLKYDTGQGVRRANFVVHLHIVSSVEFRYNGQDEANSRFDLLDLPYKLLHFYNGCGLSGVTHLGSQTNNDHEELVESIESFGGFAVG